LYLYLYLLYYKHYGTSRSIAMRFSIPYPRDDPRAAMGVVAPPQAPPFPITVEQFVAEVEPPSSAATAAQACAAFAQLATRAVVPGTFRSAVPPVLELVSREGEGLLEAKECALASLVALLACVPGAAEDAAAHKAVARVLAACEDAPGGRLDGNALEAFRVLVTADAAAAATVADDDAVTKLIRFVTDRAVGSARAAKGGIARDRDIAESALDLLCGLASKRSDGGAARDAVVKRGGVSALGRALVAARNDEIAVRALLGLAMTVEREEHRKEFVAVPGACAALTRATRSPDGDVAGVSRALLRALGEDEASRLAVAAALRETMASGAMADVDTA